MGMESTALLLIDIQEGLDDPFQGQRNNPDFETNVARLLDSWRRREKPIIHIRHCSVEPGSLLRPELPGNQFKAEAVPLPAETRFDKSTQCAFIGTGP
jgi:nicotinamidase-related amidase